MGFSGAAISERQEMGWETLLGANLVEFGCWIAPQGHDPGPSWGYWLYFKHPRWEAATIASLPAGVRHPLTAA